MEGTLYPFEAKMKHCAAWKLQDWFRHCLCSAVLLEASNTGKPDTFLIPIKIMLCNPLFPADFSVNKLTGSLPPSLSVFKGTNSGNIIVITNAAMCAQMCWCKFWCVFASDHAAAARYHQKWEYPHIISNFLLLQHECPYSFRGTLCSWFMNPVYMHTYCTGITHWRTTFCCASTWQTMHTSTCGQAVWIHIGSGAGKRNQSNNSNSSGFQLYDMCQWCATQWP